VPVATTVDIARELIADIVRANAEKNRQGRIEAAKKKELHSLMAKHGIENIRHEVDNELIEAVIAAGEKTTIDVAALYNAVELPVFLSTVSATQGAVKEKCGSNVLAMVSTAKATDPVLSVKKVKA
jgi:hypothetical protein